MTKADFSKLLKKLLNITLSPHVLDILFAVFGNEQPAAGAAAPAAAAGGAAGGGDGGATLDTPVFLEVLQRREIMWARRVSARNSRLYMLAGQMLDALL